MYHQETLEKTKFFLKKNNFFHTNDILATSIDAKVVTSHTNFESHLLGQIGNSNVQKKFTALCKMKEGLFLCKKSCGFI